MAKRSAKQFARLDLDYADNPKIAELSDAAFRAHIEMILYSRTYLTDGRIPTRTLTRWDTQAVTELLSNDHEAPSLYMLDDGSALLHGYEDMQETKAEVQARQQASRVNGSKGGRPKTQRVSDQVPQQANPPGTLDEKQRREEEEKTIHAQPTVAREPSRFPDWWSIWGKKVSKGDAEKAYKAALKKISHDDLMTKTQAYWDHVKATGTELQFVPYPGKWLRAEQWDDDLTTGTPQQAPVFDPRNWKV